MPTSLPEATLPLIALPSSTRGTASYSAIEFDERTDKMVFATPDGLASYPRQFLIAPQSALTTPQSKSPLPALHIRSIVVDGQTVYHGNGLQPQITVKSTRNEVLVYLAVLDWQTACRDERLVVESDARTTIILAVGPNCTVRFAIDDFENKPSQINFRLAVDGQTVTQDAHLKIKLSRPVIFSPLLPLILGVTLGLWVLFNRLAVEQPWPEAIQKYTALASGLFILLATAQALGFIVSPGTVLSVMALWFGVLLTAFIVPVFGEILLRTSARLMIWNT